MFGFGNGLSDPYCICQVSPKPLTGDKQQDSKLKSGLSEAFRTPVIKDDLNPTWNHTATISNYIDEDFLIFTVLDKDPKLKKDDLLGETTLEISKLTEAQSSETEEENEKVGTAPDRGVEMLQVELEE